MNLLELKTNVDKAIESLSKNLTPEEVSVYITLSKPSLGDRSFTSVSCITMGFDWKHRQFRIQPEDDLIKKSTPKTVKLMYEIEQDEYVCTNCNAFLQDYFKYCPCCGGEIGGLK